MKKYGIVAVIAVVTALCALLIQGKLAMPEPADLDYVLTMDGQGTRAVLAREDGLSYHLYEVDRTGTVTGYQVIRSDDRMTKRRILQLLAVEDRVYAVMEEKNRTTGTVTGYRVVMAGLEDGSVKTVAEAGPELFTQITGLTEEEGSLVLCGVLRSEPYVAGYRIPLTVPETAGEGEVRNREFLFIQPVPSGEETEDAQYLGGVLYLRTVSGRVGRYAVDGFEEIMRDEEEGQFAFLTAGKDLVWCYDRSLNRMVPMSRGETPGFSLPDELDVRAAYMQSMEEGIFLGEQKGVPVLFWQKGDSSRGIYELKPNLEISLVLAGPYVPRTAGAVLLLCAFLLFAWWVYGKNGRISLKLSFLYLAACLVLGAIWIGWLVSNGVALLSQKRLLLSGLAVVLLLFFTVSITVEAVTRPLRSLSRYMDRVSAGNFRIQKSARSHDEVSEVWASMNRMCNALEAGRYRYRQLLQSYYRFVPRDIEKIFGKESITQLSGGEVLGVDGTIGILTVQNRASIRAGSSDEDYIELVKNYFLMVRDLYSRYGGILSSTEMDLSGVKVLFPDARCRVAAFGIWLLTVNREKQAEERYWMDVFVLIHKTQFLYGLAGTKEQAFPFFSSAEVEYLSSYIADFRGTGVRMVMTGQAEQEGEERCEKRYIGYIPDQGGEGRYELYEVLDACPEAERVGRRNTEKSFTEGLSLYYRGDFYLARNQFLEVLKDCPEDGIARWYLFSSETYFREGEGGSADFSLFGHGQKAGDRA